MTPAARLDAAIALLAAVERAVRKPADAVANDFFRARRFIGSGDRRAVSDRVWQVLRTRRRLGWWLEQVGLPETPYFLVAGSLLLEGWTYDGVSQSFSGGQYAPTRIPAQEGARLRQLEGRTLGPPQMPEAVRLELPEFVLPLLRARFGSELELELTALEGEAPLDLRVNLLKGSREEAIVALAAEGLTAAPTPFSPWGLRIEGRRAVTAGAAFQCGLVEIQDEGSQLVAAMVQAAPELRVLDYCAGAGGKTLAMAMAMGNRGHIVACDVSAPRLDAAVKRLRRAGIHNVERHLLEPGDKWAKRRAGSFDRVLVDAPCTGTGTWRRNPDARLRLAAQDLAELVGKQAAILDRAANLVRPGGRLIYATCSLLVEENESQVAGFLDRHPQFAAVPPPVLVPDQAPDALTLSLSPRLHRTDGFFAAVLQRAAA